MPSVSRGQSLRLEIASGQPSFSPCQAVRLHLYSVYLALSSRFSFPESSPLARVDFPLKNTRVDSHRFTPFRTSSSFLLPPLVFFFPLPSAPKTVSSALSSSSDKPSLPMTKAKARDTKPDARLTATVTKNLDAHRGWGGPWRSCRLPCTAEG